MNRRRRSNRAVLHQVAARCLAYPDADLHAELPLLRDALRGRTDPGATLLRGFLDEAAGTPEQRLAAHHVEVFDFRNRRCLHLSWWTDGDTRRRGMSLVRFKETYRAYGLEHRADGELPDHLPVVLEFCARTGTDTLLREHRPALELLRFALEEHGTPYARVLQALCRALPGTSPRDRAAARALAHGGPPREQVGLEPYGHPPAPLPASTGDQP